MTNAGRPVWRRYVHHPQTHTDAMNTTLLLLAGATTLGQCPTPSLSDCLKACPPANDHAPFLRTPSVEPVGPCQGAAACDETKNVWKHSFHKAAAFPFPRFGQCGEPVEADGLVIYEGMRLTVNKETGVYDLSFTATAPPTPVTLRLQLEFTLEKHPAVRLTLPPIEIDPVPTADPLRPKAATVRVSHRGFSELFLDTGRQSDSFDLKTKGAFQVTKCWSINRNGTARFGSAMPNSDGLNR